MLPHWVSQSQRPQLVMGRALWLCQPLDMSLLQLLSCEVERSGMSQPTALGRVHLFLCRMIVRWSEEEHAKGWTKLSSFPCLTAMSRREKVQDRCWAGLTSFPCRTHYWGANGEAGKAVTGWAIAVPDLATMQL